MPEDERPDRDDVRRALLGFARLVERLDEEGHLDRALPYLVGRLGDLRHLLFEYEVRFTERLLPVEDPRERESRRIVREARERELEAREEWGEGWTPDAEDDHPAGDDEDTDPGGGDHDDGDPGSGDDESGPA